jgi:hypothetical protein
LTPGIAATLASAHADISSSSSVTATLAARAAPLAPRVPTSAVREKVRRAASVVLADKVINDATEVLLEVHHIERDVKLGGNQARIGSVIDGATTLVTDLE